MDLAIVIAFKYPRAEFFLLGNEYSGLEWHDKKVEKPTPKDIEIAAKEYEEFKLKNAYKTKRAAEYPSIEDQLDMIYHHGLDKWRDSIKVVKDKFPKKEGEISIKPIDGLELKMKTVEDSLEQLAKGLTTAQSNSQNIKDLITEVNSAMSAIKGFMMIMPDLQKSLLEIKDIVETK